MFENIFAFELLSIPMLASNIITVAFLFLAGFFAIKYTSAFFGERPTPKSWICIIAGLLAICIAELFEFLFLYKAPAEFAVQIIILATHTAGGLLILGGCAMLLKEVWIE